MYRGGYGAPGYGAPGYGAPGYGAPQGRGYGVDVNRDGIVDYRVQPGKLVDVNRDGIPDYRTAPRVVPGPGVGMPPAYGRPAYGGGYRY